MMFRVRKVFVLRALIRGKHDKIEEVKHGLGPFARTVHETAKASAKMKTKTTSLPVVLAEIFLA